MTRAKNRKYHYIYKITCNITNRFYIGMHSTNNLDDGYFGSGKRLWFSINYHGKENHVKEILEFLPSRQILKEREKEIVTKELIGEDLCMNLQEGGGGGFISEEHMLKCSFAGNAKIRQLLDTNLDFKEKYCKIRSDNNKRLHKEGKLSKPDNFNFKGNKHNEETKIKIGKSSSDKQSGKQNSQYGTCWITKENTNKKIKKENLETYLNEGWVKGRIKYN